MLRRPGRVLPGLQLDQLKYSGAKDLQAAVRKHFREGGTQRPESERLDQVCPAIHAAHRSYTRQSLNARLHRPSQPCGCSRSSGRCMLRAAPA